MEWQWNFKQVTHCCCITIKSLKFSNFFIFLQIKILNFDLPQKRKNIILPPRVDGGIGFYGYDNWGVLDW
jgi:hypothetical protein